MTEYGRQGSVYPPRMRPVALVALLLVACSSAAFEPASDAGAGDADAEAATVRDAGPPLFRECLLEPGHACAPAEAPGAVTAPQTCWPVHTTESTRDAYSRCTFLCTEDGGIDQRRRELCTALGGTCERASPGSALQICVPR